MCMSSSSSSSHPPPPKDDDPAPPHKYFEDELASDLEKDDSAILSRRFNVYSNIRKLQRKIDRRTYSRVIKSQTQWTRCLDAVQEHFSSHVTLDGSSYRLPHKLYALKLAAKHSWVLYKKRECERRKRLRQKLEREKAKDERGDPANTLLAMVDQCEICKHFFVTVNLFWGTTMCDACYFDPEVIKHVMSAKSSMAEKSLEITPNNVVEKVLKLRNNTMLNSYYFNPNIDQPPPIPPSKDVRKTLVTFKDLSPIDPPATLSSSSEVEEVIHEISSDDDEGLPILSSTAPGEDPPSQIPSQILDMIMGDFSQTQSASQSLASIQDYYDDPVDYPTTPYNDPLDYPGSQQ